MSGQRVKDDDLDDLLGDISPKPEKKPRKSKRIGRPPKGSQAPIIPAAGAKAPALSKGDPDLDELPDGELPDASAFTRPVRVNFLATILGTETRRLLPKLAHCPVIGYEMHRGKEVPVYDFKTAIAYLVEPKMDIATWIKSQNAAHLPVQINKAFWEAENAKLRWMAAAKQYWHDEDVLDVLGSAAMAIKETTLLWVENLPGKANLTTEQFEALQGNVVDLLDDIHQRLVEIPATRKTRPVSRHAEDFGVDPES